MFDHPARQPPEKVLKLKEEVVGYSRYLFAGKTLDDADTQLLADIARIGSPQGSAKACLALAAKLDQPKLSMAEIEHSEKMAEAHQRYLAIISVIDRRFQYLGEDRGDFYEQMTAIRQDTERRKFVTPEEKADWISKKAEPVQVEIQREQLTKLAQSVREYIAWARRNGLQ